MLVFKVSRCFLLMVTAITLTISGQTSKFTFRKHLNSSVFRREAEKNKVGVVKYYGPSGTRSESALSRQMYGGWGDEDEIHINYHIHETFDTDENNKYFEDFDECGQLESPCGYVGRPRCCKGFVCDTSKRNCQKCTPDGSPCSVRTCCEGSYCSPIQHKCIKFAARNTACDVREPGACLEYSDSCVKGVCRPMCVNRGTPCSDTLPCCGLYDRCVSGECKLCRKNGESCTRRTDCCWKASLCQNGRCKGCTEVGENEVGDCKSNSDCCSKNAECGKYAKGRCSFKKDTSCNGLGDGCTWSRKCCKRYTCTEQTTASNFNAYVCKL